MADLLYDVMELANGARFYRCALQVNPYAYLVRQGKTAGFQDVESYNAAIVEALVREEIEVISITDHYRVETSEDLRRCAEEAGIIVLPGFEAVTKDGVHLLCIFDRDRDPQFMERVIGDCGIHEDSDASPIGQYDLVEMLDRARSWDTICVAAHVVGGGGLLKKLSGQSAMNAWKSPNLLACAIGGSVDQAPESLRLILLNKNSEYKRERPVAVVNALDVSSPNDLTNPGTSTLVKMSTVSVEGLRQAFLDPGSRIRLASDSVPDDHVQFLAIFWEGGFLDELGIRFNENLNVLIGGRGAGKSTVIESIRAVLGASALGKDAQKASDGIVSQVLRNGTKISLLVRSQHPSPRNYMIERTLPNAPIVRDGSGTVLKLTPNDVVPHFEVYGQHEIAELSKSGQLTGLIDRFVEADPALAAATVKNQRALRTSRTELLKVADEVAEANDELASLPALEETFERFREAGLESRLKDQSLLVTERQHMETATSNIEAVEDSVKEALANAKLDTDFISDSEIEDLPGGTFLIEARNVLEDTDRNIRSALGALNSAIGQGRDKLSAVVDRWKMQRETPALAEYDKVLRELRRENVDAEEFIETRTKMEQLRPLRTTVDELVAKQANLEQTRRTLVAEWQDSNAAEFRRLERGSKRISHQLGGKVRVQVKFESNREPLVELLRGEIDGRISEALGILSSFPQLSLPGLAATCREGPDQLVNTFAMTPAQAERIAGAGEAVFMRIEELELSPATLLELNIGSAKAPIWRLLDDLSTGQKATAVLFLLLLDSDAPLVVDQPEDDLDNRFITEGIVPKMREGKRRRQFIFSTHNANIPVLGDAELIVTLSASGEANAGNATIDPNGLGSMDVVQVQKSVEELLEGGREAFEMRRAKYGF